MAEMKLTTGWYARVVVESSEVKTKATKNRAAFAIRCAVNVRVMVRQGLECGHIHWFQKSAHGSKRADCFYCDNRHDIPKLRPECLVHNWIPVRGPDDPAVERLAREAVVDEVKKTP